MSASVTYPTLFSPFRIGAREVANRIVWTAHDTNMAVDHLPSPAQAEYYGARAAGGVGLIVMEATSVHPTAEIHGSCVHAYLPESVDGYSRIARRVHEHGTVIVVQLAHQGVHMNFNKNLTAGWGPSAVPGPVEREIPHVIDRAEIAELVGSYAQSARHVVAGGLDGVEVSASHSYLPAQFLSPWYNRRTDEYGGSLENRLRFLIEIVVAVRSAVGANSVLGVRLSGEEMTKFGLQVADTIEIAKAIEATKLVDYLSISTGSMHTRHLIAAPMAIQPGHQIPATARIKQQTGLPIIAVGRILHPDLAEEVVASGKADLVGMTRALIADPDLPEKARTGAADEIRRCIGINQACRQRFFLGKSISCTVNPHAGREGQMRQPPPHRRRMLVVGGGPAGLHAATVLAECGHEVVLHEAGSELGGQARLAARLPGREEINGLIEDLTRLARRRGVAIHLGSRITEARVDADVVVLATGSRPRDLPIAEYPALMTSSPELGGPRIRTLWDAVEGRLSGRNALVIDELGRYQGLGAAELLLDRGWKVAVCSTMAVLGDRLMPTGDFPLITARVLEKGADLYPLHALTAIDGTTVILSHVMAPDRKVRLNGVDEIVVVCGNQADEALYRSLVNAGVSEVHRIGDCVAPRGLDEAIYEAETLALRL